MFKLDMDFFTSAISIFWFARTIKFVLFWIYLWQLKNYHVGRFIDHFRTHQGKKLLLDPLLAIKIILLPLILLNFLFAWVLLLLYIAECALFAVQIIRGSFKKPVFTSKVILLAIVSFAGAVVFLFLTLKYLSGIPVILALLLFDIVTPLAVSLVVLFFQPFFVAMRNRILEKARQKMSQFKNITVIGITGSYGKTSTKEFLTTILASRFSVLSTPDHKNSEIGIAQTILQDLKPEHQVFVVEMGSYNKGGIKLLCDIVKPKIGIVTGVNEQHLATFGSLENLLSAEGGRELAQSLPKDGVIILNGDNKYCLDLYKKFPGNKKIYTVKRNTIDSDIWTEEIEVGTESLSFITVSRQKEIGHFTVKVLGAQNVQNLLAAILSARELGMSLEQIQEACSSIQAKQAGIVVKSGALGIHIIDSSHSSNPDGVAADLEYLNIFKNKKVIVMPCLIELGEVSAEAHRQIGKKIAEVCDLAIITTKDQFQEIKKGATINGLSENRIIFSDNPKDIFTTITTSCKEGDAVLLEGRVPGELIKLLITKKDRSE